MTRHDSCYSRSRVDSWSCCWQRTQLFVRGIALRLHASDLTRSLSLVLSCLRTVSIFRKWCKYCSTDHIQIRINAQLPNGYSELHNQRPPNFTETVVHFTKSTGGDREPVHTYISDELFNRILGELSNLQNLFRVHVHRAPSDWFEPQIGHVLRQFTCSQNTIQQSTVEQVSLCLYCNNIGNQFCILD